jgi:hypothetical protein
MRAQCGTTHLRSVFGCLKTMNRLGKRTDWIDEEGARVYASCLVVPIIKGDQVSIIVLQLWSLRNTSMHIICLLVMWNISVYMVRVIRTGNKDSVNDYPCLFGIISQRDRKHAGFLEMPSSSRETNANSIIGNLFCCRILRRDSRCAASHDISYS